MEAPKKFDIQAYVKKSLAAFDYSKNETAIILAAGHGKRIKSETSKMLHKIWGKPTVKRVYEACGKGLEKANIIVVIGIKAEDVLNSLIANGEISFAYQAQQKGTGHAVQIALENIDHKKYEGIVYVFPGDMGLIDDQTVSAFRKKFRESDSDMMVLTGLYEGSPETNSYGRIIRVKEKDLNGNPSGDDFGKVIEIMENKDILSLEGNKHYIVHFNKRQYAFTKEELINNNEFNSGVYAFKFKHLAEHINSITSDNAQNEIYITDLIALFNKSGLTVSASHPEDQTVLIGFNNKSVLKQMESIARSKTYETLKDIIEIEDPDDFFINDETVQKILELDRNGQPLDIRIGKGAYLGNGVIPNYRLNIKKNSYLDGNIKLGENVTIWENVYLSTFPQQNFIIGNNVEIFWGDIIKGNIIIGDNSRIESSVNMTGSDLFPLRIGNNVTIKGTSYLFGSIIEDNVFIEHCVLIKKKVLNKDGKKEKKVLFYLPKPEGSQLVEDI